MAKIVTEQERSEVELGHLIAIEKISPLELQVLRLAWRSRSSALFDCLLYYIRTPRLRSPSTLR